MWSHTHKYYQPIQVLKKILILKPISILYKIFKETIKTNHGYI